MNSTLPTQTIVRSLKGAPLSVLTLMLWNRMTHGPVWEVDELISGTDYQRPAIAEARRVLIHFGLVEPAEHGRYGLRLVDRAVRQLGLWDALPPAEDIIDGQADLMARSEKLISLPSSSSSSYRKEEEEERGNFVKRENEIRKTDLKMRKEDGDYPGEIRKTDLTPDDLIRETLAYNALRNAGIGEPVRTELSKLAWVTEAYVKAHANAAKLKREPITFAITRMRGDDPAPAWCPKCNQLNRHLLSCPDHPSQAQAAAPQSAPATTPEPSEDVDAYYARLEQAFARRRAEEDSKRRRP